MTTPSTATQTRYPWRATLRTALAGLVALASILPYLFTDLNIPAVGVAGQALGVATFVTRLMAIPQFNDWLTGVGLGATPK